MKTIELAEATGSLEEYVRELGHEPIVVAKYGLPVAALLPVENADLETIKLSKDPQFIALIELSRSRQKAHGSISPSEMRRKLGLTS